jgi:hypothetical protein
MKLRHGLHLAYCTNIHRGESWPEMFDALKRYALAVRDQVGAGKPYGIGLRLSHQAARELAEPTALKTFRQWLDRENCYIFTINGFPYGRFHGTRVKEQVYAPDWTTRERLGYTTLLFDLLAELLPANIEGSVSTVPVSFKEFIQYEEQVRQTRAHLWSCVEHIERVSQRSGKKLHLGLEPEPLCYLETSGETVAYFEQLRADRPGDLRLEEFLGVNYDCCHLAVEFEEARAALNRLRKAGIKISKIHLSNALKLRATPEARAALKAFSDNVYFHQVIERDSDGRTARYKDLPDALAQSGRVGSESPAEWRVHFHVPLHWQPAGLFETTADHLLEVLDELQADSGICSHFEMETYTWEVMPPEMKKRSVVEQLVTEYQWTLRELALRGFTRE